MRQRISVEQITSPISDDERNQALSVIDQQITALSQLDSHWLAFCHEKIALANENMGFSLRQWQQAHRRGYPSRDIPYLRLIEKQFAKLSEAYLALYRFAPGLIYELKASAPEIYVWLMLHSSLGESLGNVLSALDCAGELEANFALLAVTQSNLPGLDAHLVACVEGQVSFAPHCLTWLLERQSVSTSLLKRWLKAALFPARTLHLALASFNHSDSIEWLEENAEYDQHLFERLLVKQDRNTWFRRTFGIEQSALESHSAQTYAKLLELKEFMAFDVTAKTAVTQYALCGETSWTPAVIEHLQGLDEQAGEAWLQALYLVYGDLLPVKPSALGIDYQWSEAVELLTQWQAGPQPVLTLPSRLGFALSFESSLSAMRSSEIDEQLRRWIWRQLCLHCRVYLGWHPMLPVVQQDWLFRKLKETSTAAERFNLRNHHAVVGH